MFHIDDIMALEREQKRQNYSHRYAHYYLKWQSHLDIILERIVIIAALHPKHVYVVVLAESGVAHQPRLSCHRHSATPFRCGKL